MDHRMMRDIVNFVNFEVLDLTLYVTTQLKNKAGVQISTKGTISFLLPELLTILHGNNMELHYRCVLLNYLCLVLGE